MKNRNLKFCGLLFFIFGIFMSGLILNPKLVYGWGATTPGFATHQFIDTEAYKCLKEDPAFVSVVFPTLEEILAKEGNSIITGGLGPGPDADGNSPYTWHYYNPRLKGKFKGRGPEYVKEFSKRLMESERKNPRPAAWNGHFLADMFTPVHVVGVPVEDILYLYNERTEHGKNKAAVTLPQEITGPEGEPNRNWRREIERFLAAVDEAEKKVATRRDKYNYVDFFDPWYWDYPDKPPPIHPLVQLGGAITQTTLLATHGQWEMRVPKHERLSDACIYDANWENAQPSFYDPIEAYATQAELSAIKAADETMQNQLERKNQHPQIALERAIQAVYTLWRASFSALKPTIQFSSVDRGRKRIYEITGTVLNLADENAKGVQVKLTVWDGENIKFRGEQKIGEVKGNRGTKKTPEAWKVEIDTPDPNNPEAKLPKLKLELEVIGSFAKTPDYQYAVSEKEIEVEPASAQREIRLVSAKVPEDIKVGQQIEGELEVELKDIAPDEKVTVSVKYWWMRAGKLVKETESRPEAEVTQNAPRATFKVGMVFTQAAQHIWYYRVEASGYKPLEGAVPFQVREEARAPVTSVTPPAQPPAVKANYVYVLDYTSYGGGAGAEAGGISPTENTVPPPKKRSGKVAGSQTSFAFGMYGVFGDYSYSGEANVRGQLTISGLPQSVKPGEKLSVTATVSGGGTWHRKGKSSLPVYFRLNGEEKLSLTETVTVPDDGREEWEPVTFSGSGTVPEFFRDSYSISVTPHYRRFEAGKVPADVRPKDLDTYPEKLPPEFEASMNKFIEEAVAKAKQEETQVTQPPEDTTAEKKRLAQLPPPKQITSPPAQTGAAILSSPLPWTNPRVQEIINSWLNIARPVIQQEQGGNWFYDEWGRAYNNTTIKKPTQKPDTTLDRYQYLWNISGQLNSVSHLTLREYIEKTLRGEAIVPKPAPRAAPVLVPQPPPGTPTGTSVGQAAPVFQTTDINGQLFDLSKLRAKTVILFFWFTYDPPCRSAVSSLQNVIKQYSKEDLQVVGIDPREDAERIKSVLAQIGFDSIQISDLQGQLATSYKTQFLPNIFVIDPRGVIKFTGYGKDIPNSADFQRAVREAVEEAKQYRK